MSIPGDKAEEALAAVQELKKGAAATEARLSHLERSGQEVLKQVININNKIDQLCKLFEQFSSPSEMGSAKKASPPPGFQSTPPATALTDEELAFLKRQEIEGKIKIHHQPVQFSGIDDPGASGSGIYPQDMKEVLVAGANSMMQAALAVLKRQGRCIDMRRLPAVPEDDGGDEDSADN